MRLKPATDFIYVRSMGKLLRVTAMFTDTDKANAYMAGADEGVVACFGPYILLANLYDKGEVVKTDFTK